MGKRALRALVVAILLVSAASYAAESEIDAAKKAVGSSLAKVYVHLKYDEGEAPGGGGHGHRVMWHVPGMDFDVDGEAPLVLPGFVLDRDVVLTRDPALSGIEDRFVDRIEVEIAGRMYPAAMERYALRNDGAFLRLASPAESGTPLVFERDAKGPYKAVVYGRGQDGAWQVSVESLRETVDDDGGKRTWSPSPAIIVSSKFKVAGAAFSSALPADGGWKGSPLLWPHVLAKDYEALAEQIRARTERGLLRVTVNFRREQSVRWDRAADYAERQAPTEMQAVGMLLADGRVLVLASLSRRDTARIESITMKVAGSEVPLAIEGALSRYGALVARYDGQPEGAEPLREEETAFEDRIDWFFAGCTVLYQQEARDERFQRESVSRVDKGFLGLQWPVRTAQKPNTFIFTAEGALAAVPLRPRQNIEMQEYYYGPWSAEYGDFTMPVSRLREILADPAAVDATYKPLSEDDRKRRVWLGIELQVLTPQLARAKNASLATEGGEVGALVSHVYADSPAARAGVEVGDVLLRFVAPDQVRPIVVRAREEQEFEFPWDALDQMPDMEFEYMPRPWPSQDNPLNRVLTEVGAGKTIAAEFVRNGEVRKLDFPLEIGPADFEAAARYENESAGITVKDLTFEVRNYFKMAGGEPGVVISDIEKGSKASVAGLKPCEIITAVDGEPVRNTEDFKTALAAGGEAKLAVKRMSQTRVVKIKLLSAADGAEKAGPEAAPSTDSAAVEPAATPGEPEDGEGAEVEKAPE